MATPTTSELSYCEGNGYTKVVGDPTDVNPSFEYTSHPEFNDVSKDSHNSQRPAPPVCKSKLISTSEYPIEEANRHISVISESVPIICKHLDSEGQRLSVTIFGLSDWSQSDRSEVNGSLQMSTRSPCIAERENTRANSCVCKSAPIF